MRFAVTGEHCPGYGGSMQFVVALTVLAVAVAVAVVYWRTDPRHRLPASVRPEPRERYRAERPARHG